MTDPLADIRAREAAATPGPWCWRGNMDNGDPYLTSTGWITTTGSDGHERRHKGHDVLGHIPHEITRDEARRHVSADALPYPVVAEDPADTYDARYEAATEAQVEAEIDRITTDVFGEPVKEMRLAFCTDWLYTQARDLVVFEVAPTATSREDPKVYRADITGIRHPDAIFIEHAREDVKRLLAEVDDLRVQLAADKSPEQMLREFHATADLPLPDRPTARPELGSQTGRAMILAEEICELADAIEAGDITEIADACADVVYAVVGTAVTYGVPFDAVFAEVHRSNMTKLIPPVVINGDGKIVKGPGYEPPDIARALGLDGENADA